MSSSCRQLCYGVWHCSKDFVEHRRGATSQAAVTSHAGAIAQKYKHCMQNCHFSSFCSGACFALPMRRHSAAAADLDRQSFDRACLATAQQLLAGLSSHGHTLRCLLRSKHTHNSVCLMQHPSPAVQADCDRLKLATSVSAAADWQCFIMEQLQTSMRDTYCLQGQSVAPQGQ